MSIATTGRPRAMWSVRILSRLVDFPAPLATTMSPWADSWWSESTTCLPALSAPRTSAASNARARERFRRVAIARAVRNSSTPSATAMSTVGAQLTGASITPAKTSSGQ
jgi:hypothetical protein